MLFSQLKENIVQSPAMKWLGHIFKRLQQGIVSKARVLQKSRTINKH